MRAVIIGGGEIKNYDYIKNKIKADDFVICADGGYNHAVNMDITPDILIGDLDSARGYEGFSNRIEYPTRKDFTDGELAVSYATENGYNDIVLIAMTSGRADHTIADILLLNKCPSGVLIDDNNEIYLLKDRVDVSGRAGQTVSIIPINGDAEGITTQGLEYPLNGETLYFAGTRGISNVMLGNKCAVSIKKGMALIIKVENV